MQEQDLFFIRQVYDLARESARQGFDPFAALLVKDGTVKARSQDRCIVYADPTAHAELTLISEYCRREQLISLEDYTLYANVEPCVMCSGAIHWSRITRVVFGVSQKMLQQVSGGKPKPDSEALINIGRQRVEVTGPVLPEEGLNVFRAFPFRSKKNGFAAFKANQQAETDPALHDDFYCREVLSRRTPVEKVWETNRVLAFKHTQPYWEAHIVIVPKQHIRSVRDLPADPELKRQLLEAIEAVSALLEEKYGGCRVSTNVGDYQSTRHLHFYVHAGKRIRDEEGRPIS